LSAIAPQARLAARRWIGGARSALNGDEGHAAGAPDAGL